jgi:hypothetical protein
MARILEVLPLAEAVIVVRGGRDVVESGVRSFDWRYEDAVTRGVDGARRVSAALQCEQPRQGLLVVCYKEVCQEESGEIKRVLHLFDFDQSLFDFASAAEMDVVGSSETWRGFVCRLFLGGTTSAVTRTNV